MIEIGEERTDVAVPATPDKEWLQTDGELPNISPVVARRVAKVLRKRLGRKIPRQVNRALYRDKPAGRVRREKCFEWPIASGNEYMAFDSDPEDTVLDAITVDQWEDLRNGAITWGDLVWTQIPNTETVREYKLGIQRASQRADWVLVFSQQIDPMDGSLHQVSVSLADFIHSLGPKFISMIEAAASDGRITKLEFRNALLASDADTRLLKKLRDWYDNGELTDAV